MALLSLHILSKQYANVDNEKSIELCPTMNINHGEFSLQDERNIQMQITLKLGLQWFGKPLTTSYAEK